MDICFFSPVWADGLLKSYQLLKRMLMDSDNKLLKLKCGDIHATMRSDMTALMWKGMWDAWLLTNVHKTWVEATSITHMAGLIHPPLLKATVSKWPMSTKQREWLIAIQLVREHGSEQRSYFFTCWTWMFISFNLTSHQNLHLTLVQDLCEMNVRKPWLQYNTRQSNEPWK